MYLEVYVLIGSMLLLILLGLPLFLSIGCSALITLFFLLPNLPLELIPQNLLGGVAEAFPCWPFRSFFWREKS